MYIMTQEYGVHKIFDCDVCLLTNVESAARNHLTPQVGWW